MLQNWKRRSISGWQTGRVTRLHSSGKLQPMSFMKTGQGRSLDHELTGARPGVLLVPYLCALSASGAAVSPALITISFPVGAAAKQCHRGKPLKPAEAFGKVTRSTVAIDRLGPGGSTTMPSVRGFIVSESGRIRTFWVHCATRALQLYRTGARLRGVMRGYSGD